MVKQLIAGVLAGLFFVMTAPQAGAAQTGASAPVLEATLDNGMHVVIVTNHLAPVATTSLTYGVGSNDDTIPGIAHATEHMLFRGTTGISSDQFANIATRIGAQYNAQTTNMSTRFYFTVPSTYLDVVLRLEADRMRNAAMAQADWANERGAIEQEVKAQLGNPLLPVTTRVSTILYGDSPWARDAVGTIAGFEKMQAADIASFYRTWYHANNATLVIAGDVDAAREMASIRDLFGAEPAAKLPAHPPLTAAALPATTIEETVDFPVPIALIVFRLPGFNNPDFAPLQVLFGALNSKRGAIADLALSGKALGGVVLYQAFPTLGSGFMLTALRPGSDPKNSLADLDSLIAAYGKDGVPADLIAASKTRILASKAYEGASIPGQAEEWSSAIALQQTAPDRIYAAFDSVTADDVNRVFKKYIAGGNHVTVALTAKAGASMPHVQNLQAGENVTVKAQKSVALPAWTSAYFSAPMRVPRRDDRTTIYHFKNGLTVAVRREAFSPTVVVEGHIWNNTDLNEPRGKDGVATIASSLLALGTTQHDVKAYQSELDTIAASVNLGTRFSAECRSADFDKTVALLAEGMLHPAFPAAKFSIVSKDIVQSLRGSEDRPESRAQIARLYAEYPPGDLHRRHATSTTMAAVSLDDVRRWYALAYRPNLTTISVVGDVAPSAVRASFQRYFGSWKVVGPNPKLRYPTAGGKVQQTSTTISSPTSKQASVTLSQRIPLRRGDRDVIALTLANTMLSGEGTGSMLFHDVRKAKGYVYSIDSELNVDDNGASFELNYAADPKNVAPAQQTAAETLQRLRSFPAAPSDLALAKAMMLSGYIVSLDTYSSVAHELLASTEQGVNGNDIAHYYGSVLEMTPKDVQQAMRRWIDPAKFTRVIIAPSAP